MLGRLGVEKPEDVVIRELLEGTAAHTGPEFFSALVRHLALALDVAGAWVTEFSANRRRLRAFSFWYQDRYIPDYEYSVEGTPCEPVVDRCTLVHVPDNVVELYPRDPDLAPMNAVSYLAMPLVGDDGCVLGHLAVLDIRPLALTARVEALFRIFGARAAAELRRLRSEQRTRDRERQLSSIFDSTWEPILVLDEQDLIREANRAARAKFGLDAAGEAPVAFPSLLPPDPASRWQRGPDARLLSGLELRSAAGSYFPAEVSVAPFQRDGGQYRTLVVRDLQEQREAERRLALLAEELEDLRPVGKLIGECPAMRVLFGQIRKVAATSVTVLIQGETGTGKELVARAIHDSSPRHGKPLVRVNCGAIPAALMESEFFGHEKGAFTGATERREGRFALADGGTLFLDEIGELPLDLQVKLLRVLQEGEFEPVGGARTRRVDVRVIAATNRDLPGEIERGRFRADLYYRLNVFPIQVPPLRSRGSDIDLLAGALVEGLGRRLGRRFRPLSRAALGLLRGYHWPGNVRELENVLERAAILARGEEISLDGVLHTVQASSADAPPSSAATCVLSAAELETFERDNLIRALEVCGWRVAGELGAAKLLGVAPSTFSSRMKALGVARPHDKSSAAVP